MSELEVSVGAEPETTEESLPDQQLDAETSAAEPEKEEATEEASTEKPEDEEIKSKKRSAQERINQITKQKNEELRASQAEIERLKARLDATEGIKRDLTEYDLEKAERSAEIARNDVMRSRVEAAKLEIPDYDEVVKASTAHIEQKVAQAVLDSDLSPQIFYHLAKNPEVLKDLNGMTEREANKEILRLEIMLQDNQPIAKKVSDAPPPIKPVNSGKGVVQKAAHEMSQEEYEANRKKQGARWAR